jgi:hypothetical protein
MREKALQITAGLGTDNFTVLMAGSTDLQGDTTLFLKLCQVKAGLLMQ